MVDYIPNKIIPILLWGGSGTRLWPQSRASYPKQYLKYNLKGDFSFPSLLSLPLVVQTKYFVIM